MATDSTELPVGKVDLARDLAACKRVLAALAHELKNPRQAMENLLYLLRAQPDLNAESQLLAQRLGAELERMGVIIDQMLAAHRVPLRREFLNPALVLESILSFYSSKIAFKNIAVERRFDNNLDQIYASPTEVQQIFSNLVGNALESVRRAGTLVLRVYASRPWEGRRGLRVLVADDGPGIQAEFRGKIFEPFFTTKEKGSGLGLWVCRVLVERNGGSIRFHTTTRAGHSGTAFLVFLPSEGRSLHENP